VHARPGSLPSFRLRFAALTDAQNAALPAPAKKQIIA